MTTFLLEEQMAVIMNPIPNMTYEDLRAVYKNRKMNGIEKNSWKNFIKKYRDSYK